MALVLTLSALAPAAAAAEDDQALLSHLDARGWAWVAPQVAATRQESPLAPGAPLAGLGGAGADAEAYLRLRGWGVTAAASARGSWSEPRPATGAAVLDELYWEGEPLGQHLTVGKKVMSWDVGFAYRPLDVIQQEDRRQLHPFALEGVPLLAWEWFGEEAAVTVVWANPLQGPAAAARDEQAVAARLFRRLGPADLHLVVRYSDRIRLEAGAAGVAVLADGLEVHGSLRWRERDARLAVREGAVTSLGLEDTVAGLAGLTWNPGWELSITAEVFRDPAGSPAEEWRTLGAAAAPARALAAFDRPDLLPWSAVVHASRSFGRLTPSLDLLATPEDGGLVASATLAWEGERVRLEGGARLFTGAAGAAYRLFPGWGILYASLEFLL